MRVNELMWIREQEAEAAQVDKKIEALLAKRS